MYSDRLDKLELYKTSIHIGDETRQNPQLSIAIPPSAFVSALSIDEL